MLDICIADSRLDINNTLHNPELLPTLDFDSDHKAILITLPYTTTPANEISTDKVLHRNYKQLKWKKFNSLLLETHKNTCPKNCNLSTEDIDYYIDEITNNVNEALDLAFKQTRKNNLDRSQFWSINLIKLHKEKSKMLTKFNKLRRYDSEVRLRPTITIKNELKRIKYNIHMETAKAIENHWANTYKKIDHRAPDKFLPTIKKIINPKTSPKIETLLINVDDHKITNKISNNMNNTPVANNKLIIAETKDKLNTLAAHYENINSPNNLNLGSRLRDIVTNNIKSFKNEMNIYTTANGSITTFSNINSALNPTPPLSEPNYFINLEMLQEILKKLPGKVSAGTDNIPAVVLKHLPIKIVAELTALFNNAINISYFPRYWKTAIIIPIKKKNKEGSNPASYRPISLTTCLSKVFEILINRAITHHANKHNLISDNQFGFKQKHSTINAIHKLLSDVNHNLTKRKAVSAVLIDLEKAFDTVWLDGLLFKLIKANFPKQLL